VVDRLFSAGIWKDRILTLLTKPCQPANKLEQHLVRLVDDEYPQCAFCFRPISQVNLLRHLGTHFGKRVSRGLRPFYELPDLEGRQAKLFSTCFIGGCEAVFYTPRRQSSFGKQLLSHLGTHAQKDLAKYAFNLALIKQDLLGSTNNA